MPVSLFYEPGRSNLGCGKEPHSMSATKLGREQLSLMLAVVLTCMQEPGRGFPGILAKVICPPPTTLSRLFQAPCSPRWTIISMVFNGASHRASVNREQKPRETVLDICIQNWIQSAQRLATISVWLPCLPSAKLGRVTDPGRKEGKEGEGVLFCTERNKFHCSRIPGETFHLSKRHCGRQKQRAGRYCWEKGAPFRHSEAGVPVGSYTHLPCQQHGLLLRTAPLPL